MDGPEVTRTRQVGWQAETYRDLACEFVDLSGVHLGARLERIPPGQTSSYHHFHTAEEEHVHMLEGTATLHLGEEQIALEAGDHVCFPAGVEVGHHLENTSDTDVTYLVFGERLEHDVVVYPAHDVMVVKALDRRRFSTKAPKG